MDTCLIRRTPYYYRQFALSLVKESPYIIISKFKPLNMDTPLIRELCTAPWASVSVLKGFDCTLKGYVTHFQQLQTVPNSLYLNRNSSSLALANEARVLNS